MRFWEQTSAIRGKKLHDLVREHVSMGSQKQRIKKYVSGNYWGISVRFQWRDFRREMTWRWPGDVQLWSVWLYFSTQRFLVVDNGPPVPASRSHTPRGLPESGYIVSFEAVELLELVIVELVELIPCQVIASANLHKASPRAGRCCERKNMLQSH